MHVGICSIYYIAMMQVQQPTTMSKKKKKIPTTFICYTYSGFLTYMKQVEMHYHIVDCSKTDCQTNNTTMLTIIFLPCYNYVLN
jgi:hypothetical protein